MAEFNYSLSEPFSWRGIYNEVAFTIEEGQSTKQSIIKKINQALTYEFTGWKGGIYYYDENTPIHFEESHGRWSDGDYTEEWINKLTNTELVYSREEKLVKLLFN